MISILFCVLLFNHLEDDDTKNIELKRVVEVIHQKDYGETDGFPNTESVTDSGIVISSDKQYLYIITLYSIDRNRYFFCWTDEVKKFYDENPSKTDIELEGELIKRSAIYGLSLFKVKKPKDFNFKKIKIGLPTNKDRFILAIKDYYIENKINKYKYEIAYFERQTNPTKDIIDIYVGYKPDNPPPGGGIVFNEKGELIGIIDTFLPDYKHLRLISGTTINNFIKGIKEIK